MKANKLNKNSRFWIMISAAVFCLIIIVVISIHNWQRIQSVFNDFNKNSIPLLEQTADLSVEIFLLRAELFRYYSNFEPSPSLIIVQFKRVEGRAQEISGYTLSQNNRRTFENITSSIDRFGSLLDQFIQLKQQNSIVESTITANHLIGNSFAIASLAQQLNTGIHKDMTEKNIQTQDLLLRDTAILSVISGVIVLLLLFGILFQTRLLDKMVQEKTRELKTRLKEIGEKTKELQQAQKMESVGRLAGGVAHDFNNKLTIINIYAEMAIDMIDPSDPLHEMIQEIQTAGKQSADIVRQLLTFARKQIISPEQLDLNDTISSMLKMLQRLIGENIDLKWHPGSSLWQVKIDPSQVDQIMANLVVNSRDAISDVGKLTIETKNTKIDEDYRKTNPEARPGRYVMLAVSDNGCGIEAEFMDQLFEPYFTTKEIGKGTGLGLPTIYGIVQQNKGFVNVYSEPGRGTTFKLYFPSCETEKSSVYAAKAPTGQMPAGTETILIVEDEKGILQLSSRILERLGYTLLIAENPREALQLSKEYNETIHLLITDVVMPDMNGRDLASQLAMIVPGIKTLYMSGYTANAIVHHGVLDEGVLFIQKPFSMKGLAVKVREAIEQE